MVETGASGRPVLVADSLNLRAAEVALVRHAVQHAETLAAAAAMLGISARQLQPRPGSSASRCPSPRGRPAGHE
jgi:hypothetical protein